jgi:hypothetical protein
MEQVLDRKCPLQHPIILEAIQQILYEAAEISDDLKRARRVQGEQQLLSENPMF